MIDLFEIFDIRQVKKENHIESYTLVDFTVGYDDLIYLLFSEKVPERINGMFCNTIANTRYCSITILFDWKSNSVCSTIFRDFGVLEFNYHFIRPLENNIMLLGSRCRYHSKDNVEQNVLLFDDSGSTVREFCIGDGIEDCITTEAGKIITSYFDEGIFGNFGWDNPIGSSGLVVWDADGKMIWENKAYSIYSCYAMNMDSSNQLWFYYYDKFDLVRTDFKVDIVMNPGLRGCSAFALSKNQRQVIFSGGYNDLSFYQFDLDIPHKKLAKKRKVRICFQNEEIKDSTYHFCGPKLLFLIDDALCGYDFLE